MKESNINLLDLFHLRIKLEATQSKCMSFVVCERFRFHPPTQDEAVDLPVQLLWKVDSYSRTAG